jgi:hypothetical protein
MPRALLLVGMVSLAAAANNWMGSWTFHDAGSITEPLELVSAGGFLNITLTVDTHRVVSSGALHFPVRADQPCLHDRILLLFRTRRMATSATTPGPTTTTVKAPSPARLCASSRVTWWRLS